MACCFSKSTALFAQSNSYKIIGTVFYEKNGRPLREVLINCYRTHRDTSQQKLRLEYLPEYQSTTDKEGSFTLTLDGTQEYMLTFLSEKYTYSNNFLSFKPINISEGQAMQVSVGMYKGENKILKGKIIDQYTQKPISKAQVYLQGEHTPIYWLSSNTKGQFYFQDQFAEKYNLRISKPYYFQLRESFSLEKKGVHTQVFPLLPVRIGEEYYMRSFFFNINDFSIDEARAQELFFLLEMLINNPSVSVEIGSHTDARGDDEYNMMISQKRANVIVDFLVNKGIDPGRLRSVGYGESKLLNHCENGVMCSNKEHLENRRISVKIIDFDEE
ncbi:OmpA family protein [Algivirga pacifica]